MKSKHARQPKTDDARLAVFASRCNTRSASALEVRELSKCEIQHSHDVVRNKLPLQTKIQYAEHASSVTFWILKQR